MALRATSFRRAEPLVDEPFGIVVLDADERHIRRKRIMLANGEDILVDFEKPVHLEQGDLLVTSRTDPDWEPILKKASGVVTDQGGRTCHAAIIAREMGITAIVGTGDGTTSIRDVIAFPKTAKGTCLMTDSPGTAEPRQLRDLHLEVKVAKKE